MWLQGQRHSEAGVTDLARSVMVHSAMAFLADDKTLGALGQASRLYSRNKALFGSLTSDSLEVCFLPLTLFWSFHAGVCPCPDGLRVINISFQPGFLSQRIRSRVTQANRICPQPHMMVDAFGNGDDCRKAMSSPESGNIDYKVWTQFNYWHYFVRTASSSRQFQLTGAGLW